MCSITHSLGVTYIGISTGSLGGVYIIGYLLAGQSLQKGRRLVSWLRGSLGEVCLQAEDMLDGAVCISTITGINACRMGCLWQVGRHLYTEYYWQAGRRLYRQHSM
jgi:hypothetical protein